MMKQQFEPVFNTPNSAGQSKATCKILPFRKPDFRRSPEHDEAVSPDLTIEPANDCCPVEERSFIPVFSSEHSNVIPCHAWVERAEEPSETVSPHAHRWFKKALLLGAFTAWTVAAIAISIALG